MKVGLKDRIKPELLKKRGMGMEEEVDAEEE